MFLSPCLFPESPGAQTPLSQPRDAAAAPMPLSESREEAGVMGKASLPTSGDGAKPLLQHRFSVQPSKAQAGKEVESSWCFHLPPGACISTMVLASHSQCLQCWWLHLTRHLHLSPGACISTLVLTSYTCYLHLPSGSCISLLVLAFCPCHGGHSQVQLPQGLEARLYHPSGGQHKGFVASL